MKIKTILQCILLITGILINTRVFATEQIPYKNLPNNRCISVSSDNQTWINKCSKKNMCYKKRELYNDSQGPVYYTKSGEVAFATGCQYDFIRNGKFIGYSNSDLNFYEFSFDENAKLAKRQLSYDEIAELFKDYKIIKISEFSPITNSLRIRKGMNDLNLIIYNDKNLNFDFYEFGSNNAKYTKYPLKGFLKVRKQGMIHFSHYGDNTKKNPLYLILVR